MPTKLAVAAPWYPGFDDGTGVDLEPSMVVLPAIMVKFAQVRRVALLECTTMERLPKKAAGPLAVER